LDESGVKRFVTSFAQAQRLPNPSVMPGVVR
jgi:hypothetical protein